MYFQNTGFYPDGPLLDEPLSMSILGCWLNIKYLRDFVDFSGFEEFSFLMYLTKENVKNKRIY